MRRFSVWLGAGLFLAAAASYGQSSLQAGERFFADLEGEWVGTAQQRVDGEQPLTRYFHLTVRRQGDGAFAMTVQYYRANPQTGALEAAGSEQGTSTLQPDGTVQRRMDGTGQVLFENRPKPEAHSAIGHARATAAGGLEGEANGTIRVDGLPLGIGKRGKIERAREEWTVGNGVLTGHTAFVACFKKLFFCKRFKVETTCRAERGSDVAALAPRREIARASAH
jgi:hypothetical protein